MSAKPRKGTAATSITAKGTAVPKNEKDHAANFNEPHSVATPSPQSSGKSITTTASSNKKRALADNTTPDLTKFGSTPQHLT
ncbi:hypothetical protein AAVH_39395 [Aphelenchoides avenae]|nr:hypothetical protein AAVH_39395 [Aphelenchus avenae]